MKWGTVDILKILMGTYNQDKSKYANNRGLQELVEKFNLTESLKVPQQMISVEEEELANEVFSCFKKKRFYQTEGENKSEQSDNIKKILVPVISEESLKKLVNWRHTEVTSSCSHDSMSSLPGLGQVEGRMDSSACGG